MAKTQTEPPMRHCFNCGKQLGRYAYYDRYDTCGERECDREANAQFEQDRAEAHEQLDRDFGW